MVLRLLSLSQSIHVDNMISVNAQKCSKQQLRYQYVGTSVITHTVIKYSTYNYNGGTPQNHPQIAHLNQETPLIHVGHTGGTSAVSERRLRLRHVLAFQLLRYATWLMAGGGFMVDGVMVIEVAGNG